MLWTPRNFTKDPVAVHETFLCIRHYNDHSGDYEHIILPLVKTFNLASHDKLAIYRHPTLDTTYAHFLTYAECTSPPCQIHSYTETSTFVAISPFDSTQWPEENFLDLLQPESEAPTTDTDPPF